MIWITLVITWPYVRTYRHYTSVPLRRIARASSEAELRVALAAWTVGKKEELTFVASAATISAAANIGVFSWPDVPEAYWLARCLFFMSLAFSVAAVILGHQHRSIFSIQPDIHVASEHVLLKIAYSVLGYQKSTNDEEKSRPDAEGFPSDEPPLRHVWAMRNSEFLWQCPLMLMSWAWVTFTWGISIHVISPLLFGRHENNGITIACVYLGVAGLVVVIFAWTSFWTYRGWEPGFVNINPTLVQVEREQQRLNASFVHDVSSVQSPMGRLSVAHDRSRSLSPARQRSTESRPENNAATYINMS